MIHKLLGLSALLALFLALLASPALCARGRHGLLQFHHHAHHLHQFQIQGRSSKTNIDGVNIQMVTGKADKSSREPNAFVWAPGHLAISDNMQGRDGSITDTSMPSQEAGSMKTMKTPSSAINAQAQEADSMKTINIPSSSAKLWFTPKRSGSIFGPNLESNAVANKRSLLDASSNTDSTLLGVEDANLLLGSFTIQKSHNLFSMLPRAKHVPPSGPSKNHNSVVTDIHS